MARGEGGTLADPGRSNGRFRGNGPLADSGERSIGRFRGAVHWQNQRRVTEVRAP